MVRTGDLSREQAAAVLREYGRLAPAGAPLDRRRVKDRLVGKIEQMFAEAPRTSKKEKSALARLEREAQYVEEGPRLADYGIDGASGLELGNPTAGGRLWPVCCFLASMASLGLGGAFISAALAQEPLAACCSYFRFFIGRARVSPRAKLVQGVICSRCSRTTRVLAPNPLASSMQ